MAGRVDPREQESTEVRGESAPGPTLQAEIDADRSVRSAAVFNESFDPVEGVDYGWVEDYAKEAYLSLRQSLTKLDDKAATVINYLAGGAGLFTLGSLAGVAAAKVPPVVVWWAIPSMTFAVAAIVLATIARIPRATFAPPGADKVKRLAEHYGTAEAAKKAGALLPQWHLLTALLRPTLDAKAWWLSWSNWCMVIAICLLLLPLIVSLNVPRPS